MIPPLIERISDILTRIINLREISEYLSWEDYLLTRKPIDILQKNLFLLEEFKDFVKEKKMQEKISAVLNKQRE